MSKSKGYWTKDTVRKEIQERHRDGGSLRPNDVTKDNQPLIRNARKLYGGWDIALVKAGFDWEDWYVTKPSGYWTEDRIRRKLKERKDSGKGFKPTDVFKEDPKLYSAMTNVCGSFEKALRLVDEEIANHTAVRRKGYWTKESVTNELYARKVNGQSLKPEDIRKDFEMLYEMIRKHYSS